MSSVADDRAEGRLQVVEDRAGGPEAVIVEGGETISLEALRAVKAEAPSAADRKSLREMVERVERVASAVGGLDELRRCLDVFDELGE